MKNIFKELFALARAKMKQSKKPGKSAILPDAPDFGTLNSGARVPGRAIKTGPALRKYRQGRKIRNKMSARSRRINQKIVKGVSI